LFDSSGLWVVTPWGGIRLHVVLAKRCWPEKPAVFEDFIKTETSALLFQEFRVGGSMFFGQGIAYRADMNKGRD
jgi:hypothetical protein